MATVLEDIDRSSRLLFVFKCIGDVFIRMVGLASVIEKFVWGERETEQVEKKRWWQGESRKQLLRCRNTYLHICFIHSDKHNEDYENRKNGVPATSSPRKRPRVDEISAADWFDFKYSVEEHFKISPSKQLLLKSLLYCFPQDLTKIIASNPFCN